MSHTSPHFVRYCLECGKEMSVTEARIKDGRGHFCSVACVCRHTFAGMKRPPFSAEHRAKISRNATGKHVRYKQWASITCQTCSKIFTVTPARKDEAKYCPRACSSEAKRQRTGTDHPLFTRVQMACELCGKVVWVKQAKIHEFRFCSRHCTGTYICKQMADTKDGTSIERLMAAELTTRNIPFVSQKIIADWIVDFALPEHRIAIECDGTYWHASDRQKTKDANKDHWLIAHRWRIFRFTETEIHESPSACVDKVLAVIPQ